MSHSESNHELLNAWRAGDQEAARILFLRYQSRLIALARSRLARKLARRLDPEDIVLSAYRSFFVSARDGRTEVNADGDLWPLLATIVLRKVTRQARHHSAARRAIDDELSQQSNWGEHLIGSRESEVEHAAILDDEVERLLSQLDSTASEVLVQTLQGNDTATIASAMGISDRSVRRALERIRSLLPVERAEFKRSQGTFVSRPAGTATQQTGTVTHDQFFLQEFVGAGAFSKVYRAVERSSGKPVAIKFLRKECWNDQRAIASLIREYQILQQLNHPNIITMHAWGTTDRGAAFLVEDLVIGQNLLDWRQSAKPSTSEIVAAVHTVAVAISAAHTGGVIHCDLTPTNILRRDDGHITVCDFGMARYGAGPEDIPRGGTAGFLCPEQISDAFGPVTEKSDVYGLGGLLYALLTGTPPMQGRDLPDTLSNVLSMRQPVLPSQRGAESSPELDQVILRCLEKEPAHRFAAASDLAIALSNLSHIPHGSD